jgi:hydrogenase maturation protein HypF
MQSLFDATPFYFPSRYRHACELVRRGVRTFTTTSIGRLFDAVAALLGFTREMTFEGQAAMWVEHLARMSSSVRPYPLPFENGEFDYRPLLTQIVADRLRSRDVREIARAFHGAITAAICDAACEFGYETVVISGGVFQNSILTASLRAAFGTRLLTNRLVAANDGGICVGQAAMAAFS